ARALRRPPDQAANSNPEPSKAIADWSFALVRTRRGLGYGGLRGPTAHAGANESLSRMPISLPDASPMSFSSGCDQVVGAGNCRPWAGGFSWVVNRSDPSHVTSHGPTGAKVCPACATRR